MNIGTSIATRQLGFWMCVALVVGNIIGSGIFLLPASLAPYGLNSVWAWLLTSTGALVLAVVFAGLSRAFPSAGGPYAYTRTAFGDLTAFIVIWGYWISNWVGNAALATAAVSYLSSLLPWMAESPGISAVVTLGFLWLLTAINIYGVRAASKLQLVTTILKLLPLLSIAGLGVYLAMTGSSQLHNSHLASTHFNLGSVTAAATLTLWALCGLESAAVVAEKVKDPERNIPRATIVGTALSAVIYILSCTAVLALIPGDQLAQSKAPFADAAGLFWGSSVAHWFALFAAISCLGALNGWILLNGELTLQLAKSGLLPNMLARESARRTPTFALCLIGILTTILVLMNYRKSMTDIFTFMILLSTTAALVMYLVCSLAALKLLLSGEIAAGRRTVWLAMAGVLGTLYALWTLFGAGKEAVIWGAALLLAGFPVYFWQKAARGRDVVTSRR